MSYEFARQCFQWPTVDEGERGEWKIEQFEISGEQARFAALRSAIAGGGVEAGRAPAAGRYVRLRNSRGVIMSNTPAEISDHIDPVWRALRYPERPSFVAGLGLGMVAEALLRATVARVDVVEKSPDVIALVAPGLVARWGPRIRIIEADARTWTPERPRAKKYGVAWFDIWQDICTDNLEDVTAFRRRWEPWADWRGAWVEDTLRWLKLREA